MCTTYIKYHLDMMEFATRMVVTLPLIVLEIMLSGVQDPTTLLTVPDQSLLSLNSSLMMALTMETWPKSGDCMFRMEWSLTTHRSIFLVLLLMTPSLMPSVLKSKPFLEIPMITE